MAVVEKRITRRGVPRDEYLEYFGALGEETEPGRFIGPDWEVIVEKTKPFVLFGQTMVQNDLVFRGEEKMIEDMLSEFRVKFARA